MLLCKREVENVIWLAIVLLTMQVTMILDAQLPVMFSCLGLEQFLGVAKDNQQCLCQPPKRSIKQMATEKSTWLMQLLENLHQPMKCLIPLYYDNLSAICLAKNLVFMQELSMWRCIITLSERKSCKRELS